MAELLVKAKSHWMDTLTKEEVDAMSESEKMSYDGRSRIGDIIVVKPDGWQWGNEECLPNFVVVKLPGVSVEDAKKYEESLYKVIDPDEKDFRKSRARVARRKYKVKKNFMNTVINEEKSLITMEQNKIADFINTIIEEKF